MPYPPIQGRVISLFGFPLDTGVPTNGQFISFNSGTGLWELVSGGGGGEANTSSNVGTGFGLALAKVGVDLPFKTLVQNLEIIITSSATELAFSIGVIAQSKITGLVAALATKIDTVVNVGTGVGKIFRDKVATTINLKSILAGDGIDVINNADTVEIKNLIIGIMGVNYDRDTPAGDEFYGLNNQLAGDGNELDVLMPVAVDTKFKNMTISILTNSYDGVTLWKFRVEQVDGNQVINIPATTIGEITDTVNEDSVLQQDRVNFFLLVLIF